MTETTSRGVVRPRTHWPLWSSAALLVAGGVVVVTDTADLLFFVGLAFIASGGYGLLRRPRKVRLGAAAAPRLRGSVLGPGRADRP